MNFKAIIFDFDGVIGRTMEDNYRAWDAAFREIGIVIDQEKYFLTEGMNTKGVAEMFLSQHEADLSLMDEIVDFKEHYYMENSRFEFYPGVVELLKRYSKRFQLGLVSGGSLCRLGRALPSNVLKLFSVIVTGEDVEHPKPNPEPYQKAVQLVTLEEHQCVAVENAPYGVRSAKKAGLYCIAVCSTLGKGFLSEADAIVDNVIDIDNIICG